VYEYEVEVSQSHAECCLFASNFSATVIIYLYSQLKFNY